MLLNFPVSAGIQHVHDHLPEERDRASRGAAYFRDDRVTVVDMEDEQERNGEFVGLGADHVRQEEA